MKQLSVFLENKNGSLADIMNILAHNGIDVRALSVADTTDFGILRLIVDNIDLAKKVLSERRITCSVTDVLAVEMPDAPGSLAGILTVLNRGGISVEYAYAFLTRQPGKAYVILRTPDASATEAAALLKPFDISLADDSALTE